MTPLQLLCLQFIDRFISERGGESPSTEEIRVALGLGSKSGVCRLTDALAADGYIRKPKNRVRAIEVLKMPPYGDSALHKANNPSASYNSSGPFLKIAAHIAEQTWCAADQDTVFAAIREIYP